MNMFARVAIAAAAVVVAVGFAWFNFGPSQFGIGAPRPTPTAAPTPSPRALPTTENESPLEPGTSYVTGDPFFVRVTFTAPDGWEGKVGAEYLAFANPTGREAPSGGVTFSSFVIVATDPCHPDSYGAYEFAFPSGSVDNLVSSLVNMDGTDASTPVDVEVDGYAGKQLTLTAPASFEGCTLSPDGYVVWQLPLGTKYSFVAGQRSRLWILNVNGKVLVIDVPEVPGQSAQEKADAQALFDSIQIAPAH